MVDATDAGDNGRTVLVRDADSFSRIADRNNPSILASEKTANFCLTRLSDLLAEEPEEMRWLVDGLLPSGGISILGAKPKVGKSTLARYLALAVARGDPFLNRPTVAGRVVYLALEEKRSEISAHFQTLGATEEEIYIHVGAAPDTSFAALTEAIHTYAPVLAIVDPLLKLVRLTDSNSYTEVSRALEPLIELARTSRCHILCVHHLGKGDRTGGDAILGSTALFGAVDTAMLMTRRNDQRILSSVQRYGTDLPETVVSLDAESLALTITGEVATIRRDELAVRILEELGGEELTEPEIKEHIGGMPAPISKAIRYLVETGRLERSGKGRKGDPYTYHASDAGQCSDSGMLGNPSDEIPENKSADDRIRAFRPRRTDQRFGEAVASNDHDESSATVSPSSRAKLGPDGNPLPRLCWGKDCRELGLCDAALDGRLCVSTQSPSHFKAKARRTAS